MLKWVEIDLKILAGNVRAIKKALKPGVSFMAVVKADGYGHGAAAVGKTALGNGADRLGVPGDGGGVAHPVASRPRAS